MKENEDWRVMRDLKNERPETKTSKLQFSRRVGNGMEEIGEEKDRASFAMEAATDYQDTLL